MIGQRVHPAHIGLRVGGQQKRHLFAMGFVRSAESWVSSAVSVLRKAPVEWPSFAAIPIATHFPSLRDRPIRLHHLRPTHHHWPPFFTSNPARALAISELFYTTLCTPGNRPPTSSAFCPSVLLPIFTAPTILRLLTMRLVAVLRSCRHYCSF